MGLADLEVWEPKVIAIWEPRSQGVQETDGPKTRGPRIQGIFKLEGHRAPQTQKSAILKEGSHDLDTRASGLEVQTSADPGIWGLKDLSSEDLAGAQGSREPRECTNL